MTSIPLSGWVPSSASWQPPPRPTALQDVPRPECSHVLPVVPPDRPELHLWHRSSGDLLWLLVYKCLSRWTDAEALLMSLLGGGAQENRRQTLCLHLLPLASHLQAFRRNSLSGGRGTIWRHYPGVAHVSSHLRWNAISQSHLVELMAGPGPLAGSGRQ